MARKLFTKEIVDDILRRNKEESLTIQQLCAEYGFYYTSFFNYLKRNNIETDIITNKSKYNHYFFSKIDTEEKAYYLGLLFADGYSNDRNNITLKLAEPDIYLVERLKDLINPSIKLQLKQQPGEKLAGEVYFTSKLIHDDLYKLGMLHGKSKEGRNFPLLTKDMMPHFIRGYFDGDGCISVRQKFNSKSLEVSIYSPCVPFLNQMKLYLEQELGSILTLKPDNKRLTCYALRFKNNGLKVKFFNYIYSNATIFMKRKYEKYSQLSFNGLRFS